MRVEFSPAALQHLTNILDSHLEYCGQRLKFSRQIDDIIHSLILFPESGFPEKSLADRAPSYRAKIINRNYKLIYYVDNDVIHISAIWDMRMHPAKLTKMI